VVAAAIYEALEDPSWLPTLHARTMAVLHSKHHSNEAWGPLGISYAGDVRRHFVYVHGGAVDRSRS
jgi:hypothetical protein